MVVGRSPASIDDRPSHQQATLINFLDQMSSWSTMKIANQYVVHQLKLETEISVLHVGCGTGQSTQIIAERIGPEGSVVGVDRSEALITEARRRAEGNTSSADFRRVDPWNLPFDDNAFDRCCCERVLNQFSEPDRIIDELIRVTKPGGYIVVSEQDFATIIGGPDPKLSQTIGSFFGTRFGSYMGRQLSFVFHRKGLEDISVTPHMIGPVAGEFDPILKQMSLAVASRAEGAGAISAVDREQWSHDLERAWNDGTAFLVTPYFIVAGRVPLHLPVRVDGSFATDAADYEIAYVFYRTVNGPISSQILDYFIDHPERHISRDELVEQFQLPSARSVGGALLSLSNVASHLDWKRPWTPHDDGYWIAQEDADLLRRARARRKQEEVSSNGNLSD